MLRPPRGQTNFTEKPEAIAKQQSLVVVLVGRFSGHFQLPVRLIQQILGLGGMAPHVPLVGLLGSRDLVPTPAGSTAGRRPGLDGARG